MKAQPSTSTALARMEPISAACTTVVRPSCRAKMPTNSSGRLPSVDCSRPVALGPSRSPTCSMACPIDGGQGRQGQAGHDEPERPRSAPRAGGHAGDDREHDRRTQRDPFGRLQWSQGGGGTAWAPPTVAAPGRRCDDD